MDTEVVLVTTIGTTAASSTASTPGLMTLFVAVTDGTWAASVNVATAGLRDTFAVTVTVAATPESVSARMPGVTVTFGEDTVIVGASPRIERFTTPGVTRRGVATVESFPASVSAMTTGDTVTLLVTATGRRESRGSHRPDTWRDGDVVRRRHGRREPSSGHRPESR